MARCASPDSSPSYEHGCYAWADEPRVCRSDLLGMTAEARVEVSGNTPSAGSVVHPLLRVALIAVSLYVIGANAIIVSFLVTRDYPENPWESGQTVEAWRILQGQRVYYADPALGPATQQYGYLAPWTLSRVFAVVGVNNYAGRVIELAAAIAMTLLLGLCVTRGRERWLSLVALALIFGVNTRSGNYFAQNRPDMVATFLSALALICLFSAVRQNSASRAWCGATILVAAFFFKQTSSMYAFVPSLALWFSRERRVRRYLTLVAPPIVLLALAWLLLMVLAPDAYFYMLVAQARFNLFPLRALKLLCELPMTLPLFVVLLLDLIATDRGAPARDPQLQWLVAALIVCWPASALALTKSGGTTNSLIPALVATACFCAARLDHYLHALASVRGDGARTLVTAVTVILVGQFTFPELLPNLGVLTQRDHRQEEYPQVVAYVRDLPGRVVCPEDPTISVLAKGYASRNVYMEFDVALVGGEWPATVPPYVVAEIQSADYVVDVENSRQDLIRPEQLHAWGFTPSVKGPAWTVYRVWERASPSGPAHRKPGG